MSNVLKPMKFEGFDLMVGTEPEEVANMFSGEKVTLEPVAVALHDLIKGAEVTESYDLMQKALATFAKHWPKEYMILLD